MKTMEFKRGDTINHTLTIPMSMYQLGLQVFFMAKEEPDDDQTDAQALIARKFGDSDIIETTSDAVVYRLSFSPSDTNNIALGGNPKLTLKGEFEFRYTDGVIKTYPSGYEHITVIVYPDVRRGDG